jgi:hypothetical protein
MFRPQCLKHAQGCIPAAIVHKQEVHLLVFRQKFGEAERL